MKLSINGDSHSEHPSEDGTYQLEYRDGSEDRHYSVDPETIGVADVTEAIVMYI